MPVLSQFRLLTINLFCSSFSHFTETKTRIIIITISTCQLNETLYVFVVLYRVYIQTYLNFSRSLYVITLFSSSRLSMSAQFLYSFTFFFIYGSPKEQVFGIFNHSYFTFNFHLLSNALVNTWCYLYTDIYPLFRSSSYFTLCASFTHLVSLSSFIYWHSRAHTFYCVHMDGWIFCI